MLGVIREEPDISYCSPGRRQTNFSAVTRSMRLREVQTKVRKVFLQATPLLPSSLQETRMLPPHSEQRALGSQQLTAPPSPGEAQLEGAAGSTTVSTKRFPS